MLVDSSGGYIHNLLMYTSHAPGHGHAHNALDAFDDGQSDTESEAIFQGGCIHCGSSLSLKSFPKIAGTIASVRKQREQPDDIREDEVPSKSKDKRVRNAEPSFVIEASFIRAPLNSRVEGKGSARQKTSKGKARQDPPLDSLPLDVQEAIILEELLFVLMVGSLHLICAKIKHVTGNPWNLYHVRLVVFSRRRRKSSWRQFFYTPIAR